MKSLVVLAVLAVFSVSLAVVFAADTPGSAPAAKVVRIKAGSTEKVKDAAGNVWEAESGFDGGDVAARDADLKIANTKIPEVYRSEHYGMNSFSKDLPNGKYTVKLHFAETYTDITDAGQRVFSFDVAGQTVKDFDPFKEAGGLNKAVVKTFNDVKVTNGKLTITFTANVQSPAINGIEIIPADETETKGAR